MSADSQQHLDHSYKIIFLDNYNQLTVLFCNQYQSNAMTYDLCISENMPSTFPAEVFFFF